MIQVQTDDIELSVSWLERLQSLNAVIAETGEPLVGNLAYDHLQPDYLGSPPNAVLREKRKRFREAVDGRGRLLEIGVNGGHSAFLALTANPNLEFHGVDICEHTYVLPAIDWLKTEFSERVFFYPGDCLKVLPALAKQGFRFDCFHVDGAKDTYYRDILNAVRMMSGGEAVVIIDDMQIDAVARVWERCIKQRLITNASEFPPMPDNEKYRHGIGHLAEPPGWRWTTYRLYAQALSVFVDGPSLMARAGRRVRQLVG